MDTTNPSTNSFGKEQFVLLVRAGQEWLQTNNSNQTLAEYFIQTHQVQPGEAAILASCVSSLSITDDGDTQNNESIDEPVADDNTAAYIGIGAVIAAFVIIIFAKLNGAHEQGIAILTLLFVYWGIRITASKTVGIVMDICIGAAFIFFNINNL